MCFCVAVATGCYMPVRGPAAAILSFACPKESIQRKRHPDSAFILRFYENHPWFSPCGPAYRLFKFAPGKFVAFGEGFRRASQQNEIRRPE